MSFFHKSYDTASFSLFVEPGSKEINDLREMNSYEHHKIARETLLKETASVQRLIGKDFSRSLKDLRKINTRQFDPTELCPVIDNVQGIDGYAG